ncbi:MAG: GAF domain-containing protein [Rudaea sp.]
MSRLARPGKTGLERDVAAKLPRGRAPSVDALEKRLAEAIEQQAATTEILRVIGRSPGDVQPVFETIARAALTLCRASSAGVFMRDAELVHVSALASVTPQGAEAIRNAFPRPPGRDSAAVRAVSTGRVIAIPDVLLDADYRIGDAALASGFRSTVSVPLLLDGRPIGAIGVGRPEPGPFSDSQIAMLETFATQATIAIENVRLFKELAARNRDVTDALEQQTATSGILRVISASPTDIQPVFDTIAKQSVMLCRADVGLVSTIVGDRIELVALSGVPGAGVETVRRRFPMRLGAETVTARTVRTRSVVHVFDVLADPAYETKDAARAGHFRGSLGVPMVRDEKVIGVIFLGRSKPGLFSERQVELLKTFAAQAVIAVENVRLFNQLQARTRDLTRSVAELEALSEVGRAVSSTLDLETVLTTIVSRAAQLTGMDGGAIYEYDEAREEFHLQTADRLPDALLEVLRAAPMRKGEGAIGRLAVTREPVELPDIADAGAYQSHVRDMLIRLGWRSLLAVPLLREDHLLGGLVVNRNRPGPFAPEVIALLQTFASQSTLAIQNARLFREIEHKSRELEAASRHKSEFLANMSHELRTPLNAIIGFSEVLQERMFGEINDKQAEYLGDILESGKHLLSLINDILDLSKIEAGRMELQPSAFDLPAAIENTLLLVRERAQRRGIALRRVVDPRLGTIYGDERKVKQVLLNLLTNALKFTPEGGRVDVRAELTDGAVEIAVTDTGIGIAPGDLASVFEEFRQVGTASRKVEGTGLGLAISRKFVELHGGTIGVQSRVGEGSTFTFTLPVQQPVSEA